MEKNSNPLQHSCLENPVDRGAWWAAVHRVTSSWTRLKQLSMHACIGEGNGNPFQYPCLENPRDRGAWWAAVHGVAQSRTQLKQLSSSSRVSLFLSLSPFLKVYCCHSPNFYLAEFVVTKNMKIFLRNICIIWTSLAAQTVKHLPTMQETWVLFLGICLVCSFVPSFIPSLYVVIVA